MPRCDDEVTDAQLMARFYGCESSAFSAIADRWWPRLHGFFRKMGFDASTAEDLAQDTLVKLFLTKEKLSFDLGQPLEPFLLTVARNRAIEEWRHRKPEAVVVPWLELECATAAEGPLRDETIMDLFVCIWSLPEIQQTYVLLCGKHGLGHLSHNEIAEVLGKWPPQLTQISQKARASLRECMAGKGYR